MADKDSRAGTRYADKDLIDYVDQLHAPHDDALRRTFESADGDAIPAIQLGVSESKLIQMLMRMIGAQKVVEVGTLAGYSAIRLARGLSAGGKLWSVEYSPAHAEVARANIAAAELSDRVEVIVGPGIEVLPSLAEHGPFDAVFIDADKISYDKYGEWAAHNTRTGGLLLGDNAYYFGKLLDLKDEGAAAMRRFHEDARNHYDTVCIPTPDGLLLGIRRP
jgi:caffeoyl-CoA O-methyltransferase